MAQKQGGAPDVASGPVLVFRVLACGMISAVFALTTDPGQFVRALLQHLRLPAPMGFALMQAMHVVPDLRAEMLQLRMARAIWQGRPLRRFPGPAEAITLLAYAIRRATRAALSFEARGLQPGRARTHLPQPGILRMDWTLVAAGDGALLLVLAFPPRAFAQGLCWRHRITHSSFELLWLPAVMQEGKSLLNLLACDRMQSSVTPRCAAVTCRRMHLI